MPPKGLEDQLWEKLRADVVEELIDAAASVSVEEAETYLAEAGFDVAAERARAEQFLADLEEGRIETCPPSGKRPR